MQAMILVEKEGQKAILIGKGGSMLQRIRTAAIPDISELVGCPVKLELFVRVEEEWRDRDSRISQYGYGNIDE